MFDKLKRLGTETAVYGVSTIVGRFLNFLLVPFYTNVLAPGDYGIVAYVYSLIAFLNVVYGYGMESAYFRYSSTQEIGSAKQNFSTPFITLLVSSACLSTFLVVCAPLAGAAAALPEERTRLVTYAAAILFFDTAAIVPFASLRMEGKAKTFACLKFINIVVNVGANLLLLLVFHAGVEGIFLSGLIASALTLVLLLPTIARHLQMEISAPLLRALLKFGLPYVPAGLAAMIMQVVDRPLLRLLTDDATVGIYQANYRLGIFMMLVVSMIDYAWRPFFLTNAREPNAKELFARVLTYVVLFMSALFLFLTFFLPDLVHVRLFGRYVIHPDYWSGLSIVPVVLLAYVFLGVYNNFVAGIYIEKKTRYLPAVTIAGACTNVAANFLLIPSLGMMGAAIATLLSYVVMAGALYFVVQRFYPVRYEFDRIAKIAAALALVIVLFFLLRPEAYATLVKCGLFLLFGALMYAMKFFVPGELRGLRSLLVRSPLPPASPPDVAHTDGA